MNPKPCKVQGLYFAKGYGVGGVGLGAGGFRGGACNQTLPPPPPPMYCRHLSLLGGFGFRGEGGGGSFFIQSVGVWGLTGLWVAGLRHAQTFQGCREWRPERVPSLITEKQDVQVGQ